jgi:outer membrane receptor for ferrienterochelin and colicins
MKKNKLTTALTVLGLFCVNLLLAQSTISGKVTDAETNDPIPGVNILIQGSSEGTNSDFDGNFTLTTDLNAPFTLVITSVGFSSKNIEVTSTDQVLNISLEPGENLDEIIVSASRRPQKIQEAPSSVSLVTAKDIENSAVAVDPVRHLMNIPGVQIQQQSANTINLSMRGGAGVFGTGAFPILDYRFLSTPAAGTFFTQQSGLSNIDIAKIEVVRGAASALYGPGVVSGVVHFMSKNPIDHPGTTVELLGGELNTVGAALRHAYASDNEKFGYKINVKYSKGSDFEIRGDEILPDGRNYVTTFATEIRQPVVSSNNTIDTTQPGEVLLSMNDLDDNGDGIPLATEYENFSMNGHLEFRPNDKTNAFLSAGYAKGGALFHNNIGVGYQDGTDIWAQARVQSGGFFAQVFYNNNDGGDRENPTFQYGTGLRTIAERSSLDAQVQYNFDLPSFLNSNFTVGVDHRAIFGNSDYTLYGRNDDDDDYIITGAYIQGTSDLGEKLSLTYSTRYDEINITEESGFSPSAALVYKINDRSSLRASYSSTVAAPTALETFLDFPVNSIIPGSYEVWGAGQTEAQNFAPNAPIELPGLGGLTLPQGSTSIPNAYLYGAVAGAVAPAIPAAYAGTPALEPLRNLEAGLNGILSQVPGAATLDFSSLLMASVAGLTPTGSFGTLTPYNLGDSQPMSGTPVNTGAAQLVTVNSFEVGYNGFIGDKLKVMLDVYTFERIGGTRFTAIGPTFALSGYDDAAFAQTIGQQVGADVVNSVTTALTNAYTTIAATQGLPLSAVAGGVPSLGLPALSSTIASVAGGLGQLAGGAFQQGAQGYEAAAGALFPVFGTIESERVPQNDGVSYTSFGYRQFEDSKRDYYGIDFGLEYFMNDNISIWGNASYVSQNVWIPGQDDDDGLEFPSFLNTPKNKYRAGVMFSYPEKRINGSVTYQYDGEFESNAGLWAGTVPEKNLIDANFGVRLNEKLKFDITASNLFNREYRAFPNMPIIGRRVIGKITFDL